MTDDQLIAAANRINKFLGEHLKDARKAVEPIHSLHMGTDREAQLLVSDLLAVIGALPVRVLAKLK